MKRHSWDGTAPLVEVHGCCMTIGNFDGVHLGHQALLRELVSWARQHDAPAVAVTFREHPRQVLGDSRPRILLPLDQRLELMADFGLDATVVMPFTREFARVSAEEFLSRIIATGLGARGVLLGWDACFGRNRRGNLAFLQEHAPPLGIEARGAEPVLLEHAPISSSRIRNAIRAADLAAAERLLGRRVTITGDVVRGDGRGRQLGIPTANLDPHHDILPPPGVYAALVELEERGQFPALVNIGHRPTFHGQGADIVVEAWLQDFSGDLYGQRLTLEILARLRDERRFSGPEELLAAIREDQRRLASLLEGPVSSGSAPSATTGR
jgi:riboflavin kinase/FMN adenylyltransferase